MPLAWAFALPPLPPLLEPRTPPSPPIAVEETFKDYEQEGWSKKASQYERVTLPLTSQAFEPILASFGDLTGKRLLDVCAGPGHLAGEAAARGALVDAVDFSEAMVREAKARFSGIGFMEGDAEALPYDDVSFDAVACCFGLPGSSMASRREPTGNADSRDTRQSRRTINSGVGIAMRPYLELRQELAKAYPTSAEWRSAAQEIC